MKNKKLRLKVTDNCQRACEGCCNKDFLDVEPFNFTTAGQYKEAYLTGGEPMLMPGMVKALTSFFNTLGIKVFIYSSMCNTKDVLNWQQLILSHKVSGITFTIHEEADIHEFKRLDRIVNNNLSLRLNKFDHFTMEYIPLHNWEIKEIHWLKNCPLPIGEDFRRL